MGRRRFRETECHFLLQPSLWLLFVRLGVELIPVRGCLRFQEIEDRAFLACVFGEVSKQYSRSREDVQT